MKSVPKRGLSVPPTANKCRCLFFVPQKSMGDVRGPSSGLLVTHCGCKFSSQESQHCLGSRLTVTAQINPLHGLHTSCPHSGFSEFCGNLSCGSCPREAGGPQQTPSHPQGPASHLPAPQAVTLRPVKAEEGRMSHERCLRRPGQCQATKWQVPGG